ncbi:MAG TPA: hypothetical protein VF169_25965 [Albitalea sp.]|uniref:hypothetical protein n=1 Tax=Piscinibacter sp. TaxID=1903157 RepID=UPI002ED030E3
MDVLGGLWHLLNFFAPALGIALFASAMAKLLWRSALQGVPWLRMALWSAGWAIAASVGGLLYFGRDGKMATYAAMVLACAFSLWWRGFGPGRR